MVLWTAVILVQMMVILRLPAYAETEKSERKIIEKTVNYYQAEEDKFPETITVTVQDGETSQEVSCHMAEKKVTGEQWQADFEVPVTFQDYGSDYYRLGSLEIPFKEDSTGLEGCEEELLNQLGLSSECYQITEFQWAGEPYENERGVLCRDAKGKGQRLVKDYAVTYRGEFLKAVPEASVGETERVSTIEETSFSEIFQENLQPEPGHFLWKKVTNILLIAVGVGGILFFGGLLFLGVLQVVKCCRKWYNNEDW